MRTMKRILFALGFAASLASCAPAYAELQTVPSKMVCGTAKEIQEVLREDRNETHVSGGTVSEQVIVVLYASKDGATFSVVSFGVDGSACMMASGKDWTGMDGPEGEPSGEPS